MCIAIIDYEKFKDVLRDYLAESLIDEIISGMNDNDVFEEDKVKKPIRNDKCTCPNCGTYNETIKKRRNTVSEDIVYCWHCGQALLVRR